jgi:hypothetical protein
MGTDTPNIMNKCQTAVSRRLDQALEQSFPASDPPELAEPAGDARDAGACCCKKHVPAAGPEAEPVAEGACVCSEGSAA